MKKLTLCLAGGAGLLAGCNMTGPTGVRVHEALLYGGAQERVTWVYGELSSRAGGTQGALNLGGRAVEVRAQVVAPLATPGSLSVNGQATYRTPTAPMAQKLSVTRVGGSLYNVTLNDAAVRAVYVTDGQIWQKLSGVSGTVTAADTRGLEGAGHLTPAEAGALASVLQGQGPLAVAVLAPESAPDAPLKTEPAPAEHLVTALYVLPGVPTAQATAPQPVPRPTPGGPVTGTPLTLTQVASGSNATITEFSVQVARTASAASALYASAYGRQTGAPTAPALNGRTLVGVFLGQRSTGGYSISVREARLNGPVLTLVAEVRAPGEGTLTTQALTSPWTVVSVPATFSEVQVVDPSGRPLDTSGGEESR